MDFKKKLFDRKCGKHTLISLAMASIAPAPAQIPSTAAIAGCRQFLIALTKSPVILVKASNTFILILVSGPIISLTSPPEQKFFPGYSDDDNFHLLRVYEVSKMVPHFSIGFKS